MGLYVKLAPHVGQTYHNPVDDVVVTHEPTPVTENDWVIDLIASGLLIECDGPAAAEAPQPVELEQPTSEPHDDGHTFSTLG